MKVFFCCVSQNRDDEIKFYDRFPTGKSLSNMLSCFRGRRKAGDSPAVTMAIVFLLILLHAIVASAGRTTSQPDGQMFDVDQTSTDHHLASIKHGGRHYWHWLHKQQQQQQRQDHQTPVGKRSRRWREVANGESSDEESYRVPMVDNDQAAVRSRKDAENGSDLHADEENHGNHGEDGHNGIHVASWRWDEIGIYITFTTFIIVAGLAKVGNESHTFPTFSPSSVCAKDGTFRTEDSLISRSMSRLARDYIYFFFIRQIIEIKFFLRYYCARSGRRWPS